MSDDAKAKLLLTLLMEQSNELRYRAQAEATYTAATVASFGATAWGVAAVASFKGNSSAILLAVFGIAALAGAVCWRIWTDHTRFANAKRARAEICRKLEALSSSYSDAIPQPIKDAFAGRGHLSAMAIVIVAAIGAAIFCLAIRGNGC